MPSIFEYMHSSYCLSTSKRKIAKSHGGSLGLNKPNRHTIILAWINQSPSADSLIGMQIVKFHYVEITLLVWYRV